MFGLSTRFERSSVIGTDKTNEERIIEICRILGGDIYYSGTGAKKYQNDKDFASKGITLQYSDFAPFIYPQL